MLTETMPGLLLGLLGAVWAALLFGGLIVGTPNSERTGRIPTWMRMGSSLTLVVAAWTFALLLRTTPHADIALLAAAGMTLGFVGDLFMAKLIIRSEQSVFGGIGAFGLGHVAYIAALIGIASQFGLQDAAPRWAALGLALAFGAACWYVVVLRGAASPSALHWAALPYALLLATTAGLAGGLALQDARFIPVAIGGLLFLTSDLILAAQLFNQAYFPWISDWVWLTYGPAQMLIVYGLGLALSSAAAS
ncbi:MAG: lysoplasmalogenase [Chloroflexi bacterium]|nr:lysoplasmalogenase [Chloroflexota bacterium]